MPLDPGRLDAGRLDPAGLGLSALDPAALASAVFGHVGMVLLAALGLSMALGVLRGAIAGWLAGAIRPGRWTLATMVALAAGFGTEWRHSALPEFQAQAAGILAALAGAFGGV